MIWQQPRSDCAFIEVTLRSMAIPLHRASVFELWPEQSLAAQREADIGTPITRSAPTTQISLRHKIRK